MKFNLNFVFILLVLISCQIIMADAATLRASQVEELRANGEYCFKNENCISKNCIYVESSANLRFKYKCQ